MCALVVASASGVGSWTSASPFLNSERADPSERASLGICVPPNSTAATTMRTTTPSNPKISASMAVLLFLFVVVYGWVVCGRVVCRWVLCGSTHDPGRDVGRRRQRQVVECGLDQVQSLEPRQPVDGTIDALDPFPAVVVTEEMVHEKLHLGVGHDPGPDGRPVAAEGETRETARRGTLGQPHPGTERVEVDVPALLSHD